MCLAIAAIPLPMGENGERRGIEVVRGALKCDRFKAVREVGVRQLSLEV